MAGIVCGISRGVEPRYSAVVENAKVIPQKLNPRPQEELNGSQALKEDFTALYAAMSDADLLELAAEGGLRPEAEAPFAAEVAARGIGPAAIAAERERLTRARLQAAVGRNPYYKFKGTGLRFRGNTFLSVEDREQGISLRTRWVMLWFLSLIPLGSYRVQTPKRKTSSWQYTIISRERLSWPQVMRGWAETSAVIILITWLVLWMHRR